MGEILFISDCHLLGDSTETSRLLTTFLQGRAQEARSLYILGDLFEVWLGDDDPAEQHQALLETLRKFSKDRAVYFLAGNRDFLLGDEFASKHHLKIIYEPIKLTLGQQQVVLLHGDILCTDDVDYQRFRLQVRDPEWQQSFLNKPLAERRQIAASLRDDSKAAMQDKSRDIMDVNQQAVTECFEENLVDVIIHGHTHRPAKHDYPGNRIRYVLGDWSPGPSFLSWTPDNGFDLYDFRLND